MYQIICERNGQVWVVASFASYEEALAVRNGYLACGTEVVLRKV